MGKSIWQIRKENEEFYLKTYASKITRNYKWGAILFLIFWGIELITMKLSCDVLYYYKLAKTESLASQEVKEWIWQQIRRSAFSDFSNIVILFMLIIMVIIFTHFWQIKSYKLHKYWNQIRYLPLVVVLLGNLIILVLLGSRGTPYMWRSIIVALCEVIPFVVNIRLLFPMEMKKSEEKFWNIFDLAGKLIQKL